MVKLTASTRRGLVWVMDMAQADLDACEPGDLTARKRREVERALLWLLNKSRPQAKACQKAVTDKLQPDRATVVTTESR